MRAAVLTGLLSLLTVSQAVAQGPPALLPPALPREGPRGGIVEPAPAPPPTTTLPPFMTGQPGAPVPNTLPPDTLPPTCAPQMQSIPGTGRPFDMVGPRFWVGADYLLYWYTPMNVPPLVRIVPTDPATGALNTAASTAFFPSTSQIKYDALSGVRLNAGANWDKIGVDFSGFVLQKRKLNTSIFNTGVPGAIAQTYVNAGDGTATYLFSSNPGPGATQATGGVIATTSSQLWGMEANARRAWYVILADTTNLIAGFRYLDLMESLSVSSISTFPSGNTQFNTDSVRTRNTYYGGQVGINLVFGGCDRGIGLNVTSKSGIGDMHQRVDLVGLNTFTTAATGVTAVNPGGLYARGLNAGTFIRDEFAYIHDLDLKLTYNFNSRFQVSFGYSLLYVSSVVRPGDQIDMVVNDTTVPFVGTPTPSTLARPAFSWNAHSFVVQGMTFGAQFQY